MNHPIFPKRLNRSSNQWPSNLINYFADSISDPILKTLSRTHITRNIPFLFDNFNILVKIYLQVVH